MAGGDSSSSSSSPGIDEGLAVQSRATTRNAYLKKIAKKKKKKKIVEVVEKDEEL
jgi:hypothetical protein